MGNGIYAGVHFSESLGAHGVGNVGLVFEIKIDGAGRVFDLVRDFADAYVVVALFEKESARGVEDLLPDVFFMSGPTLARSHGVTEHCSVYAKHSTASREKKLAVFPK